MNRRWIRSCRPVGNLEVEVESRRLRQSRSVVRPFLLTGGLLLPAAAASQTTISGTVLVADTREPAHAAEVVVLERHEVTHTDDDGRFELVLDAEEHSHGHALLTLHVDSGFLSGIRVLVMGPEETTLEIAEPILLEPGHRGHEHIVVTDSVFESRPFEAFGSVNVIAGLDLQNERGRTLGEMLEGASGIATQGFGHGSGRPVIRGLDGDHVLVLEDGVRTGDLGSESGGSGVPLDPLQAEQIEVIRGPATLVYGSNVIGGVVNVVSMASHLAHSHHPGFRGQANLDLSSADRGVGGGARALAGGNGWMAWGGGSANRTGDYDSPAGIVENSAGSKQEGDLGFGLFGERAWVSGSVRLDDSRLGLPFLGALRGANGRGQDEPGVDVAIHRRQARADFVIRELGNVLEEASFTVRYSDLEQEEIDTPAGTTQDELANNIHNRSLIVRGELKRDAGRVHTRSGVWSRFRSVQAGGMDTLEPDVQASALAVFSYNEIHAGERLSLSFAGRLERNAYEAGERPERAGLARDEIADSANERAPPAPLDRDFTTASGSAGARFSLNDEHALVATTSTSIGAPSLEELYSFSPYPGNLYFNLGDPTLEVERAFGLDLSLRRSSERLSGSINLFRFSIADFIFMAEPGGTVGGFIVFEAAQTDAVHRGFETEVHLDLGVAELEASASYVDIKLAGAAGYAPSIPPFGGRVRLHFPIRRLQLNPELRWAARMDRLNPGETPTDGYALLNLNASWVFVGRHTTSTLSFQAFNLTDAEHRRHSALGKDLYLLMGRSFRIGYSLRFF